MISKGLIYVLVQFLAILILLLCTNARPFSLIQTFHLIAILVGVWSILTMRSSKLSVFPELIHGAALVEQGPYAVIRHPMYISVLLFFIPTIFAKLDLLMIATYLVLVINLLLKMRYDEEILKRHFSN